MDEVTTLAAVLEHARRPFCLKRAPHDARHACVRGIAWHSRSIDVVIAQVDDVGTARAGKAPGQVLLVNLRRGVHVARVEDRLLSDQGRGQSVAAGRAGRLEHAHFEVRFASRSRCDPAMVVARVGALAVDDHARRLDETTGKTQAVQRFQQRRRPRRVVVHVVHDIVEVHAETHPGRLVADGVDSI